LFLTTNHALWHTILDSGPYEANKDKQQLLPEFAHLEQKNCVKILMPTAIPGVPNIMGSKRKHG
jgi:hypothetical protein